MEHGRTIETGWCSTPSCPRPRSIATWTADPFDEIRLRLFSSGVEPVACRPSVSGAQSSSGWEGRKLPRRRRAGVPTRLRHPGPLPPGPRPGPQSLPMPDSLSLKGPRRPLDRSGMLRRRAERTAPPPQPGPDRCESSRAPAARTRMQPAPVHRGPGCGEAVDGGASGRQANRSAPAHQLRRNPRLVPASQPAPVQPLRPTGVGQLLERVV
jgi:hypothetical protein